MARLRSRPSPTESPEQPEEAGGEGGADAGPGGASPGDVLALGMRIFGEPHADMVTVYVERTRPSEHRGWCGSVTIEPDDSPETLKAKIAERWGGGEYRARLTRNGAYVRGGVGLVTIAGYPKIDRPSSAAPSSAAPSPSVVVQAPATTNASATLRDTIATLRELQGLAQSRDATGPDLAAAIARLEARIAENVGAAHNPAPALAPGNDLRSLAENVNAIRSIARTLGFVEASKQREANPEGDEGGSGPRMPKDPMEILSMMLMMQVMKGMNSPSQPAGQWVPGPDGRPVWQAAPPSQPDPMMAMMMGSMLGVQIPAGMGAPSSAPPSSAPPSWGPPTTVQPSSSPPSWAPPSSAPPSSAPRVENPTHAHAHEEADDEEEGDDEPLSPAELAEELAAVPAGQRAAFLAQVFAACPPDVAAEILQASQPPTPPRPTVVIGGRDAS